MTDERTTDVRTLAIVLLAAAIGVLLFVPTASAQDAGCADVLENDTEPDGDSSAPGGLLADAISDQRDEIGSELDDSELDRRLANATSSRERASIVADEAERIGANVSTLERCWGINRTEAVADRSLADLDDDERAALENHTLALHHRLNETQAAADQLPTTQRERYDVDEESLASLERRLVEVRNETDRQRRPSTSGESFPFP